MKMLFSAALLMICGLVHADENPIAIVIHGGAGTITKANLTPEQELQYKQKLQEAVEAGHKRLSEGESSMEAVITAIQILEDSPLFNAGKGAVYTYDEGHELDASIMDGKTLNAGAVAGVKHVKSPIALAREVMEHSVHVMLSGDGAEDFAKSRNLPMVDNSYFDTERRYQSLLKAKKQLEQDKQAWNHPEMLDYKFGTVGAVALDKRGNIVAGTSTGGMTAKRYGRIGDSPVIGAGTYADNDSCGVSATGHGEYFIRYNVAADICARVKYQQVSLEKAAHSVINERLVEAGGTGGIIALDAKGNITMPFNTEGMYRASIDSQGNLTVAIYGAAE